MGKAAPIRMTIQSYYENKLWWAYSDDIGVYGKGKTAQKAVDDLLVSAHELFEIYNQTPFKQLHKSAKLALKKLRHALAIQS